MTAGGDPADQTPEPQQPEQPGPSEEDQAPEIPQGAAFNFTSYSADGQTEYGTGVAVTTGQAAKFGDDWYAEVEVTANEADASWVGRKFFIKADAEADGTTKYPLLDAEGQRIEVSVSITEAQPDAGQGGGEDTDLDG